MAVLVGLAVVAMGVASMVFRFDTGPSVASTQATPKVAREAPKRIRSPLPPRADAVKGEPLAPRSVNAPPGAPRVRALKREFAAAPGVFKPPTALGSEPEDRRDQMEARLDELSNERGWDSDTTERVRHLLVETLDGAESRLSGIQDPREWANARRDVAQYRQAQAKRIADVLGDEEYQSFVSEMRFSRIPSLTGQPGVRWMPVRLRSGAPQP